MPVSHSVYRNVFLFLALTISISLGIACETTVHVTEKMNEKKVSEPVHLPEDASVQEQDRAREQLVEKDKPDTAPICSLAKESWKRSIMQGGRILLPNKTTTPNGTLRILELPTGWTSFEQKEQQRWVIRANYGLPGSYTVIVQLTCGSTQVRKAVSVAMYRLQWTSLPKWNSGQNGPTYREHPKVWIHPNEPNTLWLWGGLGFIPRQFSPVFDLWKVDLTTGAWSEVPTQDKLPRIQTGMVALDTDTSKVFVFGGQNEARKYSSLMHSFSYKGTIESTTYTQDAWEKGSGILGSLVYVPWLKKFVSACGYSPTGEHCHTALFDPKAPEGKRWEVLDTKGSSPSGRYGFEYALDKERKQLIVFSGGQKPEHGSPVNPANDVWALSLTKMPPTWEKIDTKDSRAPGHRNGCSALDPIGHRLFVWGGTANGRTSVKGLHVLHLDKGHEYWSTIRIPNEPVLRSSGIGIWDAKHKRVILGFGLGTQRHADLYAIQVAPNQP